MTKSMIFHHPHELNSSGKSGSQVRPFRMAEAFQQAGYEVELVTGESSERKKRIDRLLAEVRRGRKIEFVYSESSTMPTPLADPGHLPLRPLLDVAFLRELRRGGAPVGLFYRDVYWRQPAYRSSVGLIKRSIAVPFYWFDWYGYYHSVDHLFLPSLAMMSALPGMWPTTHISELPPGCNLPGNPEAAHRQRAPGLNLLYVGGVTPPFYDILPAFRLLAEFPTDSIRLTLCCRRSEWDNVSGRYGEWNPKQVQVVHAYGDGLAQLYEAADLFLLVRSSNNYLDFAMPLKVFEAIGYGVPIVTVAGNEAARFVLDQDAGWVVDSIDDLRSLLNLLKRHPSLIAQKKEHIRNLRHHHTWLARASNVAATLTALDCRANRA